MLELRLLLSLAVTSPRWLWMEMRAFALIFISICTASLAVGVHQQELAPIAGAILCLLGIWAAGMWGAWTDGVINDDQQGPR